MLFEGEQFPSRIKLWFKHESLLIKDAWGAIKPLQLQWLGPVYREPQAYGFEATFLIGASSV